MKNKLRIDFVVSQLPVNEVAHQQAPNTNSRQESMAPKIVVCPPMEDTTELMPVPRGSRLLKALNLRLTRRAPDADSMGRASSSDSSSSSDSVSTEAARSDDRSSSSASDSGSDGPVRRRNRSTVTLRRVFQSLSLATRSHSCAPTERQPKKQPQPKRILRAPVTYTYARGLSGLPTQRVPRHAVCCTSRGLYR